MEVSSAQQLDRAKQHFELKDYHGAIHLLEELIEEGRAFADAHHLLGLSYHLVDQPERALQSFDTALQLNKQICRSPRPPWGRAGRAWAG